jgi:hypothetical protein
VRMWLSNVVLPDPKNPVRIVTGTVVLGVAMLVVCKC